MTTLDPADPDYRCLALVGGFLRAWSLMEASINNAIQVAFNMEDLQFLMIRANIQFRDKIHILRAAADFSIVESRAEKKKINDTLKEISDYAAVRNMMAHDIFGPADGGGVQFIVIRARGKLHIPTEVWPETKFQEAQTKLLKFNAEIKSIMEKLRYSAIAAAFVEAGKPAPEIAPLNYLNLLLGRPIPEIQNLDSGIDTATDSSPAPSTET